MPLKLVERNLVKDLAGINRADLLRDDEITALIEMVSAEVESLTQRSFALGLKTEYHQSYDQMPTDPSPQFIQVKSPPIDSTLAVTITYSPDERWVDNGVVIPTTDYTIHADLGLISIHRSAELLVQLAIEGLSYMIFSYAPRGFKIEYTGGYASNAMPSPWTGDPSDDYGVTQVPSGLKYLVARRVAGEMTEKKFQGFTPEMLTALKSYHK